LRIRLAKNESQARELAAQLLRRLPKLDGAPLELRFRRALRASQGRLLEDGSAGMPVHAASFLRKRVIVLDGELLRRRQEFERILAHELFHFVWLRLGNPLRWSFERQLANEAARGARGELGWSAELRKRGLERQDRETRSRRWREYACESFCDTAAWLFSRRRRHDEFTLARRWREERRRWFGSIAGRVLRI